jgi:hypothetical protein
MASWAVAPTATASPGDPVRGQRLYDDTPGGVTCASCHGEATLGLLRLRFGVDPGVTRTAIVSGKGGMNQPNLLALTDIDLADIAAYIADPAAAVAVEPLIEPTAAVRFSRATTSGPPAERVVTLLNPGSASLPLGPIVVTGAGFELDNGCGSALGPQARCTLTMRFRPADLGERAGTVSGTFGVRATPWSRVLSGEGVDRPIGVLRWRDPAPVVAFTEAVTGRSTLLARAWLDNVSDAPVTLQRIGIDGAGQDDFTLTGACATPGSVLPGRTGCEIELRFAPLAVGRRSGQLSVTSDGTDPPELTLNTVGVAPGPALAIEPRALDVATRATLVLGNPGQAPLQVVALDLSDPAFQVATDGCGPLPILVAPAGTCTLEVSRVAGTRLDAVGTLTVRSATAGLSSTVRLRASRVDVTGGAVTQGNVGAGSLGTATASAVAVLLGLAWAAAALARRR